MGIATRTSQLYPFYGCNAAAAQRLRTENPLPSPSAGNSTAPDPALAQAFRTMMSGIAAAPATDLDEGLALASRFWNPALGDHVSASRKDGGKGPATAVPQIEVSAVVQLEHVAQPVAAHHRQTVDGVEAAP